MAMGTDGCFDSDPGPSRSQEKLLFFQDPSTPSQYGFESASNDDTENSIDKEGFRDQDPTTESPILGSMILGNDFIDRGSTGTNHTSSLEPEGPKSGLVPSYELGNSTYEPKGINATSSEETLQLSDLDKNSNSHERKHLSVSQLNLPTLTNKNRPIEGETEHDLFHVQGISQSGTSTMLPKKLPLTPLLNTLGEAPHPHVWPVALPRVPIYPSSPASSESSSDLTGPRKPPRRISAGVDDTKANQVSLESFPKVKKGAFIVRSWPKNGFFKMPETRSQPKPLWRPGDGFSTGEMKSKFPYIGIRKETHRSLSPEMPALSLEANDCFRDFSSFSGENTVSVEDFKRWVLKQPRRQKEIWPTPGDFRAALTDVSRVGNDSIDHHKTVGSKRRLEKVALPRPKRVFRTHGLGELENLRRSPIRRSDSAEASRLRNDLGKSLRFALETRTPPRGQRKENQANDWAEESPLADNNDDELIESTFILRGKLATHSQSLGRSLQSLGKALETPRIRSLRYTETLSGNENNGNAIDFSTQAGDLATKHQGDHTMLSSTQTEDPFGYSTSDCSREDEQETEMETQKIIPCSPGIFPPSSLERAEF